MKMILIVDIRAGSLDGIIEPIEPILTDRGLLNKYFTDKRAEQIEFITEEHLSLIFSDEVLLLGAKHGYLSAFARIKINSVSLDPNFWGVYKNKYLYARGLGKNEEIWDKKSVEYVRKGDLRALVSGEDSSAQESIDGRDPIFNQSLMFNANSKENSSREVKKEGFKRLHTSEDSS